MTEIYGKVPETIEPATNVTLLRTGDDLVLVDNGSGNKFQPTAGKLLENLAANGIDPAAVTKVVFSHAHPDHIWGTLNDDGTLAFPNAGYYVGQAEWDFWTDPDLPAQMPEDIRPFALGAQRDLGGGEGAGHAGQARRRHRVRGSASSTPRATPRATSPARRRRRRADRRRRRHRRTRSSRCATPIGRSASTPIPSRAIATRKALLDRAATDGHALSRLPLRLSRRRRSSATATATASCP